MEKKTHTIEEFCKIANDKNGKCLSLEYVNYSTKLEFECCDGHRWFATPGHIISGTWCEKCARKLRARKYTVDDDFFSRDNELSFYIAGFWLSDGWITKKDECYGVGISLANKDIDHLEKIKKTLKCTSPIKIRKRFRDYIFDVKVGKELTNCNLRFFSEKCFKDLERFGVIQNKTYYTKIPDEIVKSKYINHFLRGVIDGDGSFCEDRDHLIHFEIKGTKELLETINQIFLDNNICNPKIKKRPMEARKGTKFAAFDSLQYAGNGIVSRMYDFLYKDATIFLERKEEIAKRSKLKIVKGPFVPRIINCSIAKDDILLKAKELKSGNKIAEFFKCSPAYISKLVKNYDIREEYYKLLDDKKTLTIYLKKQQSQ
jgi:hypothetical protein